MSISSFETFYRRTYLPDHSAPLNRWVHFLSNVLAVLTLAAAAIWWSRDLFLLGVWFQLGPPYLGHILFEKSHNSIDRSWIMSAVGSWYTTFQILTGKQSITHGPRMEPAPIGAISDDEMLERLRRHGRNLHSFMVLEPGLERWRRRDESGAAAYVERGGHWVTAGAPLCAAHDSVQTTLALADEARAAGQKAAFFGVGESFVERLRRDAAAADRFDALQIGLAPSWNPAHWPDVVAKARKLRNRLRRAARADVVARRASTDELQPGSAVRERLETIVDAWSASQALPPLGFMATVEMFQHAEERRYFVAEQRGEVVGVAVAVPVYGREGWLVEDMMCAPGAASGTTELLVDVAMRELAAEGSDLVSLGLVALAGLDAPDPEAMSSTSTHARLAALLRAASRSMGWLHGFEGLYRFRKKMKPERWEPIYLVADGRVGWLTIRAVLMAFARGWIPRFGLRVLGRRLRRMQVSWSTVGLAALGLAAFSISLGGALGGWLPGWASLLTSTLAGLLLFVVVHVAAHGMLARSVLLNHGLGHLAATALSGALLPYRFVHREHHRHTNAGAADPDRWSSSGPAWSLPFRWATQDMAYLVVYLRHWAERPWGERAELLGRLALYSILLSGAAAAGILVPVVVAWIVPARLALTLLAFSFTWLPHGRHRWNGLAKGHLRHHDAVLHSGWLRSA